MIARLSKVACAALVLAFSVALAQDAPATVTAVDSQQYGTHLADTDGNSLYLYTKDAQGASTCTDACTNNWPPLLVDGDPVAGKGVDASMLGTVDRADGSHQVTYNDWPLYTFARDAQPGDINGQKLGNLFFLVGVSGKELTVERPPQKVDISQADFDALMQTGAQKFTSICSTCHGDQGQGKVGPKLDGNSDIASTDFIVNRILNGFTEHGMPPFRDQFSDFEIAAAATYVRNSWSNDYGAVTEEEVTSLR